MEKVKQNRDKIAIIAPTSLKNVPYLQYYLNILKDNRADYRILSWNRMGLEEPEVEFSFNYYLPTSEKNKRLYGYIKYANACKKYLKKEKFTKLIILTAAPAFFMGAGYLKRFSGNYILDIRDDTPIRRKLPKVFQKLCSMAGAVVVSSHKYSEWIPCETTLCHNVDIKQMEKYMGLPVREQNDGPVRIVAAGMMREADINIEMLRAVGKDSRFSFSYIGRTNEQKERIEAFAKEQELTSVTFEGTYNKEDIVDIYREKADLVNIIREKNTVNTEALPNKMYDAAVAGVPAVVFGHNEAVADYVREYRLGLVVEENMPRLADALDAQLKEFDYEAFGKGREAFFQAVFRDMECFSALVEQFIA